MKKGRLVITMESGDTSSRIVLRHLSCPELHVQSAKDHTGEEAALRSVSPRGQILKTIRTKDATHTGEEAALRSVSPRGQILKTIRTKDAWGSPQKLCPNHT